MEIVLAVENLTKEYRTGFRRKRVAAVRGVSVQVQRGEIFGFVGPNGAGKTTTIRSLMGLIRPTGGRCLVLGHEVPNKESRRRLGFLPESPYFHDYLTGLEMVDFMGRLHGLDGATRKRRAAELLDKVGLVGGAQTRPMRKYSKGMLQRAGLAQALINDPELVILDEPMSGLDPLGRKQVRDLILELRDAGKTVFFSTHILADVEAICDRVAIIMAGAVHDVGPVHKLLGDEILGTEVVLHAPGGADLSDILPAGAHTRRVEDGVIVVLEKGADVGGFLKGAIDRGRIVSVSERRKSLEDLFVQRAREAAPAAGG